MKKEILLQLDHWLDKECILYYLDYDLKNNSYSKTGSIVKRFILPKNHEQLISIICFSKRIDLDIKIIGETTNILFNDTVNYGVFISTKLVNNVQFKDSTVIVESGKSLPDFVRDVSMRGYGGYEGLEGIPGSIGGGIVMNAGAYGYEISDNIISVTYLNENGEVITKDKSSLNFEKRSSIFKHQDLIILYAEFQILSSPLEDIKNKIETFHIARHIYQEWTMPNLGSIFTAPRSLYDHFKFSSFKNRLSYKLTKKIFYNKIMRFFNRKKPSNERLNNIIKKDKNLDFLTVNCSHKNINTFCNQNNSTKEIIDYIYSIYSSIDKRNVFLENELVEKSIYEIISENDYNDITFKYKKILENEKI
ncbi:FAD-binding protein [Proteus terrae]|uniref:FAD-binding protein n=1 Tax=Proteus terrae TaxID=1574161 RepID=UPI000D6911E6|nr:FAD-binding protein [Proteus terrae]